MSFQESMELVGEAVDVAGVVAIVVGTVVATPLAGRDLLGRGSGGRDTYESYRQRLGRSILLGLELLRGSEHAPTLATGTPGPAA